jgi:hypothetical protein
MITRLAHKARTTLPGNYPHTVLGCPEGLHPSGTGIQGGAPLIILVREEKCNKNQLKVIESSLTNLSEKLKAGKSLIKR